MAPVRKRPEDRGILLHDSWFNRLKKRNHVDQLLCCKCGQELKVGDEIHRVAHSVGTGHSPIKVYHLSCWESMFIEC